MTPSVVLTLLVLAAYAAGTARHGWRIPAGLVLAGVAVVWFLVNSPVEGEVLVSVSPGHGFTAADLVGAAALLLAAHRILVPSVPWARRRHPDAE